MIKHLRQTDTTTETGDCFKMCVAMVLGLDPAGLPNFCHVGPDWWPLFQDWLAENYGLTAVEVENRPQVLGFLPPGVPVILSGTSPTYPTSPTLHAVVGVTAGYEGFRYRYDPNPCDKFLLDLKKVLFFAPLRPDLLTAGKPHGHRAPTADAA